MLTFKEACNWMEPGVLSKITPDVRDIFYFVESAHTEYEELALELMDYQWVAEGLVKNEFNLVYALTDDQFLRLVQVFYEIREQYELCLSIQNFLQRDKKEIDQAGAAKA